MLTNKSPLYELKDSFKKPETLALLGTLVSEYRELITYPHTTLMKQNKMFYSLGVLDTLYRCGEITQMQYTDYYKFFETN